MVQHLSAHWLVTVHVTRVAEHWLQQLPLLPHSPADPDAEDLLAEAGPADPHDPCKVGELVRQLLEVVVDLPVLSVSLERTAGITLGPVLRPLTGAGCERTSAKQIILAPRAASEAGEIGLPAVAEGDLTGSPSASAAEQLGTARRYSSVFTLGHRGALGLGQ